MTRNDRMKATLDEARRRFDEQARKLERRKAEREAQAKERAKRKMRSTKVTELLREGDVSEKIDEARSSLVGETEASLARVARQTLRLTGADGAWDHEAADYQARELAEAWGVLADDPTLERYASTIPQFRLQLEEFERVIKKAQQHQRLTALAG